MLTHRQRTLLSFISAYQDEHLGVSPTYAEMRGALGLASKSGVTRLLAALEERGCIARSASAGRARAIEILTPKCPHAATATQKPSIKEFGDSELLAEIIDRGYLVGRASSLSAAA
ncbi:LexA family transcriptional regulator [Sphingosinicella sp. BN140058]|uniref:LexA family protein n=1 Tax=Sphingosinicella sp. BN140058 TaxID=1892855 RepID=UPI001012E1AE|nr:hypothetical protein [Sphingosinicella sp. BN140058]QAY80157.1 hypothetical protein ETR14_26300 [Sphingosinicella sp. BN140058]